MASPGTTQDIRGLKDPIPPAPDSYIAEGVGGMAIVLIVVALIYLYLRCARAEVARTPHEIALAELWKLRDNMPTMDAGEFSLNVSGVLRVYLEKVLDIQVTDRTTQEFLSDARSHPRLAGPPLEELRKFLELCDMAKFASEALNEEQRASLLNYAVNFIEGLHLSLSAVTEEK